MNLIRVLQVDDHKLVCAGMRLLLEGLEGVQVVAEAHDGREALALVKVHHPDMVLMDIAMKGLNGLEATAHLKKEFPEIRVIILSMYSSEEHVLQGLRAGASGYLLKDAATQELEQAIRAVMRGEMYLSPPVSKQVIGDYVHRVSQGYKAADELTHRQREILQMIAEGQSTKEIAHQLDLSVKTIETHRAQLMKRLGIYDIAGLVRCAIRMGLITPE
ncbi:MAG: response regulator transcription factor [Candidatus Manganitrophus sp.]|nr:MAG: response regulator transcription factor [Candidatus Manganitrophus sp.]WDT74884.1 MAG: response regulator transcription factor [Candidatus Manganitrophus sp.]WDT79597.1 MAG: response regulator transcription factor [Candidatus Manganitrophus sp.]